MTVFRTTLLAAVLGLAGLPAVANGVVIDLPRLEFPTGADVTRTCIDPVAADGVCPRTAE